MVLLLSHLGPLIAVDTNISNVGIVHIDNAGAKAAYGWRRQEVDVCLCR